MVEVSDKPKHKPSAKHTLEEVRKSLEDVVRNQLDDALPTPPAAQSHEQTSADDGAQMPVASGHGRARRHGAGLDTQSLVRSLKGLIGDELGGANEESAPSATAEDAASGLSAPAGPASAAGEHRPEPLATAVLAPAAEASTESVSGSEEIMLEASAPGDAVSGKLADELDTGSDLPWSTKPRTVRPADRRPKQSPEAITSAPAAPDTPPHHTRERPAAPRRSIKIVDLPPAGRLPAAFAVRDPALTSLAMNGDAADRSAGPAASKSELWTYAVVTAPWPDDLRREAGYHELGMLETPAPGPEPAARSLSALADELEELTLEAPPEPEVPELSLEQEQGPSLNEELSLEGGISSLADAPPAADSVSLESDRALGDDLVLTDEFELSAPPNSKQQDGDRKEKSDLPAKTRGPQRRFDLEIPGDETAFEDIDLGSEHSRDEASPPVAAGPQDQEEEDVDLHSPLDTQLMPEGPQDQRLPETAPTAPAPGKKTEQAKPESRTPEPQKAEPTSAPAAPTAAEEQPRKPSRPRSFIPPSDPAGSFGKMPELAFETGTIGHSSDDQQGKEPKRKQPKAGERPKAGDARAKPQAPAPISLSLFEERPGAADRASAGAHVPSKPEKKPGGVPEPKQRPSRDTDVAPPPPKPAAAPSRLRPAPGAREMRPVGRKPEAAQPWPGSKLPRPAPKPSKADPADRSSSAVPVLNAVVNELSTPQAGQRPAPGKAAPARARAPEPGTMVKRPPAKQAPAGGGDPHALAVQIIAKLNMELRKCGERALSPAIISRLQYLLRDALAPRATAPKDGRDKR